MPKYFPGVTHVIINTVPSAKEMEAMKGTMAFVTLCFGPGDESSIGMIAIKKMPGPVTGLQAHIPKSPIIKDGKTAYISVITGKASDEAKMLALIAFDRMKQEFGIKFNKSYRVLAKTIEVIGGTDTVSTEVGQQPTA